MVGKIDELSMNDEWFRNWRSCGMSILEKNRTAYLCPRHTSWQVKLVVNSSSFRIVRNYSCIPLQKCMCFTNFYRVIICGYSLAALILHICSHYTSFFLSENAWRHHLHHHQWLVMSLNNKIKGCIRRLAFAINLVVECAQVCVYITQRTSDRHRWMNELPAECIDAPNSRL